ncbi:MAG: hypothetical protein JO312_18840 [Hyphomicrobiales bacterium]|nr:hypothetical protein [Hyphomicrobiales bacterium]
MRQTTIRVTSSHAKAKPASRALAAVAAFLRGLAQNAEQLTRLQKWRAILSRVFRAFLNGRLTRPPAAPRPDLMQAKGDNPFGAGQHPQHRRAQDIPLLGGVGASIPQRTVRHKGVEQPRRLQKIDEKRKLPERCHRRFVVPFDPYRPTEAVDVDPRGQIRPNN